MRSSANMSSRRSRTAVPRARARGRLAAAAILTDRPRRLTSTSDWSQLAFVATVIAACCVAGCDAACWFEPDGNGAVVIPDGETSIPDEAFQQCHSLVSVTIPDSVTSLGDYAFDACSSLVGVTIPDSVTSIGLAAFRSCSNLVSVTISGSVTSLPSACFAYCTSLVSVTIPDSVISLGRTAFYYCESLASVTIPSTTSIGSLTFSGCFCPASAYTAGATLINCVAPAPTTAPTTSEPTPSPSPAPTTSDPTPSPSPPPSTSEPTTSEPTPAPTCPAFPPATGDRPACDLALLAAPLKAAAAATFPSLAAFILATGSKSELLDFLNSAAAAGTGAAQVTATAAARSQCAIAAADRCDRNPTCVELPSTCEAL